jgi:hypothetical protein
MESGDEIVVTINLWNKANVKKCGVHLLVAEPNVKKCGVHLQATWRKFGIIF